MLFDVHEDNIVELVLSSRLYMDFRDCRACVAFTQCIISPALDCPLLTVSVASEKQRKTVVERLMASSFLLRI